MVPKFNEHNNHPSILLKYIILSFPGNMSPESGPGHSKTDSNVFKEYLVERQVMPGQLLSCHKVRMVVDRLSIQVCKSKQLLTQGALFCP